MMPLAQKLCLLHGCGGSIRRQVLQMKQREAGDERQERTRALQAGRLQSGVGTRDPVAVRPALQMCVHATG